MPCFSIEISYLLRVYMLFLLHGFIGAHCSSVLICGFDGMVYVCYSMLQVLIYDLRSSHPIRVKYHM